MAQTTLALETEKLVNRYLGNRIHNYIGIRYNDEISAIIGLLQIKESLSLSLSERIPHDLYRKGFIGLSELSYDDILPTVAGYVDKFFHDKLEKYNQ